MSLFFNSLIFHFIGTLIKSSFIYSFSTRCLRKKTFAVSVRPDVKSSHISYLAKLVILEGAVSFSDQQSYFQVERN